MKLSDALEEKQYDVRLRDKLLEQGKLTKKQLDEYMKTVEDCSAKAKMTSED